MLKPVMKHTSNEILSQLGINGKDLESWDSLEKYDLLNYDIKVTQKGIPLFIRLDIEKEVDYIKEKMKK